MRSVATSRTRVDGERRGSPRRSRRRVARRAGRPGRRRRRRRPASAGGRAGRPAGRGGPAAPRPVGSGAARRAGSSAAARVTTTPTATAVASVESGSSGPLERDRADRAEVGGHRGRKQRRRGRSRSPTRRARPRAPGQDERADLDPRRAGGAQQPDLAEPLDDGHRERVEDQERAGEQRDRGDERGRGLEVRGRGPQRVREVLPATRRRTARRAVAASRAAVTAAASASGVEADVDAGHAGLVEDGLGRVERHERPSARPTPRAARRRPGSRRPGIAPARPRPSTVSVEPMARPSVSASRWVDERARLVRRRQRPCRRSASSSCSSGSAAGSMPMTVTDGGSRPADEVGLEVGPALERRGHDGDARRGRDRGDRLRRRARPRRTPRRAGRRARRGRGRSARPRPRCRRWWPGRRTARPRRARRPTIVSVVRSGRAREAAPGERVRPCIARRAAYRPSWASRAMRRGGVVVGAPAELDRVADPAVADDEHPVGVGGRLRVVGDEDDRLAALVAGAPERVEDLGRRSCSRGCPSARRRRGGPGG